MICWPGGSLEGAFRELGMPVAEPVLPPPPPGPPTDEQIGHVVAAFVRHNIEFLPASVLTTGTCERRDRMQDPGQPHPQCVAVVVAGQQLVVHNLQRLMASRVRTGAIVVFDAATNATVRTLAVPPTGRPRSPWPRRRRSLRPGLSASTARRSRGRRQWIVCDP